MNDRAVSILEQYDCKVLSTTKVRGAIVFETPEGLRILKEYEGPAGKLQFLHELLEHVEEETGIFVDCPIPDREGNFTVTGHDGIRYVVKTHTQGRECNPVEPSDLKNAMRNLAILHKSLRYRGNALPEEYQVFYLADETARLHREITRIHKFLNARKTKNPFEQELLHSYPAFREQSLRISEELKQEDFTDFYQEIEKEKLFIHGDFQYHNCLFAEENAAIVNFEKCRMDTKVKDMALFLRKTLEKAEWSPELGDALIKEYESVTPLSQTESKQLYYRLAYPEKFRKICSFYMNSNKAFISGQLLEKLERLKDLEKKKEICMNALFGQQGGFL